MEPGTTYSTKRRNAYSTKKESTRRNALSFSTAVRATLTIITSMCNTSGRTTSMQMDENQVEGDKHRSIKEFEIIYTQ